MRKPDLSANKQLTRQHYAAYAKDPLHLPVEWLSRVGAHLFDEHGLEFLVNGVPGAHGAGRGAPDLPALSPDEAAERLLCLRDTAQATRRTQSFHHGTEKETAHSWTVQGTGSGKAIMDTYLVTPGRMIWSLLSTRKSLSTQWTVEALRTGDAAVHYADSDVSRFLVMTDMEKLQTHRTITGPQAGKTECGPLGIGASKEYRKNDEQQLLGQALLVRNLPAPNGRPSDFVLPAPLVTRYSQSGSYMALVRAMVANDAPVAEVECETHKGTVIRRIQTLAGLAGQGAKFTLVDRDEAVDLATFRARWLDTFDTDATHERDRMDVTLPDGNVQNAYAEHLARRYARIAESPRP